MYICSGTMTIEVNGKSVTAGSNQILCRMADSKQQVSAMNDLLLPALEHIRTEYTHPISLDDLADLCSISKPHLIRCFKKYLNCTPHEYLLSY